jgi:hypothetical protein
MMDAVPVSWMNFDRGDMVVSRTLTATTFGQPGNTFWPPQISGSSHYTRIVKITTDLSLLKCSMSTIRMPSPLDYYENQRQMIHTLGTGSTELV